MQLSIDTVVPHIKLKGRHADVVKAGVASSSIEGEKWYKYDPIPFSYVLPLLSQRVNPLF